MKIAFYPMFSNYCSGQSLLHKVQERLTEQYMDQHPVYMPDIHVEGHTPTHRPM